MKLAAAVCVALLTAVLLRAEDEMGPPVLPTGTRVNGRPAVPRQFPYMAYLHVTNDSGESNRCSGSLITRSAVLTAASCVHNHTTYTVRLGSIYREANDTNAWTVVSKWALVHPKYNSKNFDNNVAIIHLPRKVPLNEFIKPVSLPCSPNVSSYVGCPAIVSGWGATSPESGMSDVLRWAEVLVIPNDYCKMFGGSLAVTDRQLCAGSYTTTAYWGDQGAPLVLNTGGRYLQIGLRSKLLTDEFNTSHPSIYTRVTSFMDWIKLKTESD